MSKKKLQDPNRTRKTGSVYSFFIKDFVKRFREGNLNPEDFPVLAAKEWKNMPKEKLAVYFEEREEALKKYEVKRPIISPDIQWNRYDVF